MTPVMQQQATQAAPIYQQKQMSVMVGIVAH
jgi:hypothetical protein